MEEKDFKCCEEIIKTNSISFYKAFSKLPYKKSRAIYAIYAFCRICDDIIDESNDIDKLESLKKDLSDFENGTTKDESLWRALRVVFNEYDMDIEPFYHMIDGQYMDYNFKNIETQEELERYCYYVAGTVGLMILPIIATENHRELKDIAKDLGYAMQITNILRDIGDDLKKNRVYLPKGVIYYNGYSYEKLYNKTIDSNFIRIWEEEAILSESLYNKVNNKIKLFDKDSRLAVKLSAEFYKGILKEVRKNNYDCFNKRAVVKNKDKVGLI